MIAGASWGLAFSAEGVYRAHARHARKFLLLIGAVDAQGLLAEGSGRRAGCAATSTAAADNSAWRYFFMVNILVIKDALRSEC
ncbi:hypothetical protein HUE56_04485 (plasmid) [Azospirillum oryzae]|uniref:Uncharacterized protein n=1 Tax=Azospirillum oryzae TaxID=286727 RepID=A0A6N1AE56_9PROT|nr:hypothetical protein [Azospirillum oryzae]KAA0584521.1 hypothetical protein FZ938_29565 [Azospirillum oryzae]QKS49796.1 hypothetical protein HUE56_04485 [Azospirillum oryzae]